MKLIKRIKNKTKNYTIDIDTDNSSTVFISGMGRSGTTWLSELINYKQNYRDIFEPFLPYKVEISSSFKYLHYLNPNCQDNSLSNSAKACLYSFISASDTAIVCTSLFSRSRFSWLINVSIFSYMCL